MNELRLVEWIRRQAGARRPKELIRSIGDDCAVLRPQGGREDMLLTTDLLVEGVHFRRQTLSAAQTGYRALARALSDIAAMGGAPKWCLLSIALPDWTDSRWVRGFFAGALRLARSTRTTLVGGDLARASELACDVVLIGAAPRGKALRRDTARAGDRIYVSGELGGAALGLERGTGRAWKRHVRPEPRLGLGQFLLRRRLATACIDLSDGLSIDLHRLCRESGVRARLDKPLPVFRGATLDQALHGGEDYELLFTTPPGAAVPQSAGGVPLTCIGRIERGLEGEVTLMDRPLLPMGYDHFRQS